MDLLVLIDVVQDLGESGVSFDEEAWGSTLGLLSCRVLSKSLNPAEPQLSHAKKEPPCFPSTAVQIQSASELPTCASDPPDAHQKLLFLPEPGRLPGNYKKQKTFALTSDAGSGASSALEAG